MKCPITNKDVDPEKLQRIIYAGKELAVSREAITLLINKLGEQVVNELIIG